MHIKKKLKIKVIKRGKILCALFTLAFLLNSVIFTNTDCLGLLDGKAVHQPGKLFPRQWLHLAGITRPLETAGVLIQDFIQQTESILLIVDRLNPVTPASTKQKQAVRKRILHEDIADNGYKTIDRLSHIGVIRVLR